MKPSALRPGVQVRRKGDPKAPIYTFVCRHGSRYNRFQCDEYRGLDGADDEGYVDVSDWDMSRKFERVVTPEGQARDAIVFHAKECEANLRLANFAENEPLYGDSGVGIADGLRKLAAYSAAQAFSAASRLGVVA